MINPEWFDELIPGRLYLVENPDLDLSLELFLHYKTLYQAEYINKGTLNVYCCDCIF
jgi:hypothetical protein